MQTFKVTAHIGHDGLLRLEVPVDLVDQDVEVIVNKTIAAPVPDVHEPINPATMEEWLDLAAKSRADLLAKYGPNHFNTQDILDEIREEASEWPRKS